MTTVYIKGKEGYKRKVQKAIRHSKLEEGDHYITGENTFHNTLLYWRTSRITLKEFKKAIGAELIWKYRLQFIEDVDALIEKQANELTKKEKDLLERFKDKGVKK